LPQRRRRGKGKRTVSVKSVKLRIHPTAESRSRASVGLDHRREIQAKTLADGTAARAAATLKLEEGQWTVPSRAARKAHLRLTSARSHGRGCDKKGGCETQGDRDGVVVSLVPTIWAVGVVEASRGVEVPSHSSPCEKISEHTPRPLLA
jgi:hypothetical protein